MAPHQIELLLARDGQEKKEIREEEGPEDGDVERWDKGGRKSSNPSAQARPPKAELGQTPNEDRVVAQSQCVATRARQRWPCSLVRLGRDGILRLPGKPLRGKEPNEQVDVQNAKGVCDNEEAIK